MAEHPAFWSWISSLDLCKGSQLLSFAGCEIVGVEIMDGARLIESHPFKGPTAFVLGNEASLGMLLEALLSTQSLGQ